MPAELPYQADLTVPHGLQVASFLGDQVTCQAASRRLAVVLRRAYRKDLQATADQPARTLIFPNDVLTTPGSSLQTITASLSYLTHRTISALLPHLTFCEALVMPTPFPAMALEHYLATNNGTLDLSPPRVPAYKPRTLLRLCELLSPLLPDAPHMTGLHIPMPCLHSLEPIMPLTPVLSSLTRLSLTHGKVTYDSLLCNPASLPCGVLAELLNTVVPSALRHLSVAGPLRVSSTDRDITRRLSRFTALTFLRIPSPQHPSPQKLLTLSMPSLSFLSISHIGGPLFYPGSRGRQQDAPAGEPTSQQLKPREPEVNLPALTRLHACGTTSGVAYAASTLADALRGGTGLRALQTLDLVGYCRHGPAEESIAELARVFTRTPAADTFFLTGPPYPSVPLSTLSGVGFLEGDLGFIEGDHPRDGRHLRSVRQLIGANGGITDAADSSTRALLTSPDLRYLTLITRTAGQQFNLQLKSILEVVLCGPPLLRALCVLHQHSVPPCSAVDVTGSHALERDREWVGNGSGWVTGRRLGVAHPICALEMLHCEGGVEDDGDVAAEEDDAAPLLRTLRVSAEDFTHLIQVCFLRPVDPTIWLDKHAPCVLCALQVVSEAVLMRCD